MRQGLRGVRRGRTTVPDPRRHARWTGSTGNSEPSGPIQLWVSDFTYVSTWRGWVYVAFVVDVFSRRIVGWRQSSSCTPSSCSMRWSRLVGDRKPSDDGSLTHHPTGANTCRSLQRAAGGGPASSPQWGQRRQLRQRPGRGRSMGSTGAEVIHRRGPWKISRRWNWQRWNGSLGSTTTG